MWIGKSKYWAVREDIITLRECVEKLSKNVDKLFDENKLIREELTKKNEFIENLLSQMISGAVSSISSPKLPDRTFNRYEPPKSASTMSTKEVLEARKNGELPKLPG